MEAKEAMRNELTTKFAHHLAGWVDDTADNCICEAEELANVAVEISFKAGQQAEREWLAKMAPEEALLTDREIGDMHQPKTWPDVYDIEAAYLHGAKAELAKVWPIYQARIEAEREKMLKEVVSWLFQSPRYCDQCGTIFLESCYVKALKSGKMPQEGK